VICSSFKNIEAYLLYGRDAVYTPDADHKPSRMNWRVVIKDLRDFTEDGMNAAEWTVPQLAAFFWFRVSHWRHERGIAQDLPSWGPLCGKVKNLAMKLGNWPVLDYINTLTYHFDLFCCMVGKLTENAMLDEGALTNTLIQNAVKQYMSVGDAQKTAYREQYAEQVVARRNLYAR
jgi:hypothetical protein